MSDERLRAVVGRVAGDDEELRKQLVAYGREIQTDFELDRDLKLEEPEFGRGIYMLACRDLKAAGINPDDATEEQLLEAMRPHYPSQVIA